MNAWADYKRPPRADVPLGPLTTWGIGGVAAWFAEPESLSQLAALLAEAEARRTRVYLLGGGSNLLVTDGRLDGLVIRLPAETFGGIVIDADRGLLRLGAGAPLATAIQKAMNAGLAGMEYFAGIPGTVGGAVRMNAGGGGHAIGLRVERIDAVDAAGRFACLNRANLFFTYRRSNLENLVITETTLRLRRDLPELIRKRYDKKLAQKRNSQPLDRPSAGCVFRNPEGMRAGELLDTAGCKGMREGGAAISEQHANFFINEGNATCAEMLRLIDRARDRVLQTHGVELELEIELWV